MNELINEITGTLQWSEIAGIIAVFTAIGAGLAALANKLSGVIFRLYRENSQPRIEINLQIDADDDVDLVVQTFRPNPNYRKSPYNEVWEKDQNFTVKETQGVFIVEKSEILRHLTKPSYAYKFFLRLKPELMDKYYARMARCGLIVTGKGDIDASNEKLWRTWFLVVSEPQHPKTKDLWRVNHRL